jgi:hypothetical protein
MKRRLIVDVEATEVFDEYLTRIGSTVRLFVQNIVRSFPELRVINVGEEPLDQLEMRISHSAPGNEMTDVANPGLVDILINEDSKKVWVNVNGKCMLRAQNIQTLIVQDERKPDVTRTYVQAR